MEKQSTSEPARKRGGKRTWGTATIWTDRLHAVRRGAVERGLPFEIDAQYLEDLFNKQGGRCALSGLPIENNWRYLQPTASLDRIESEKGYVKGNVQWIHKTLNFMKSDHDQDYFVAMCLAVAAHAGEGRKLTPRERSALSGQPQCSKPEKFRHVSHRFKTEKKPPPPRPEQFTSVGCFSDEFRPFALGQVEGLTECAYEGIPSATLAFAQTEPPSPQPSQPVPPDWPARAEEPMTFTDLQFVAALGVLTMNLLVLTGGALAITAMALVITHVCRR